MKVSIIIRHVYVSIVCKPTWEFMGEWKRKRGVHLDFTALANLCLLLPLQV